jgi:hypothetical protein
MAVTFTSHGYDTTTGNPYTEIAWADAHPLIGSGTYGVRSGSDWAVTAVTGADRTVSIAPGFGWGSGVTDQTVANETIQLDTVTSGSRWDLIVARRDWTPTAGETKFMKINGGSTKSIPGGRLMTPGGIDDQPLALVQVTAGQTQPTAIVDLRCWANNGGMVAKDELVKGYLNKIGTELYIGGVEWRYVPGANDVPEWVSAVTTQDAADVTTAGSGWQLGSGGGKPRVRRVGTMVHLSGAAIRTGSGSVSNILTIPAAFRPAAGQTVFIGAGVTDNGIAYELALLNGVVSIPGGYATRTDTDQPTTYPVTGSWPLT